MSDRTTIEWATAGLDRGASWNPIRARNRATGKTGWFCVKLSAGCSFCYASAINKRLGTGLPYKPGHEKDIEIFLDEKTLRDPLRWRAPRGIFVCSMSDLFADFVPDEMIDRVFAVMALAPQHRFMVLTKRAARMREYMTRELQGPWAGRVTRVGEDNIPRPETDVGFRMRGVVTDMLCKVPGEALNRAVKLMDDRDGGEGDGFFRRWPLPNCWMGVSAEDQPTADERIPDLLATPAAVRFVSYEPALAGVDFTYIPTFTDPRSDEQNYVNALTGVEVRPGPGTSDKGPRLDWLIAGGESGPSARPAHPQWFRKVRDDCAAAGVAFFMKQWGSWDADALLYTDTQGRCPPPNMMIGKRRAGRLLDGRTHDAFPATPQ